MAGIVIMAGKTIAIVPPDIPESSDLKCTLQMAKTARDMYTVVVSVFYRIVNQVDVSHLSKLTCTGRVCV